MGALDDNLTIALRSAPEVYRDPSIGLTAATSGGDPQANAEATSHLLNTQAVGQAVDSAGTAHGGKGLLGATLGWLGHGIKGAEDMIGHGIETVGRVANTGLAEVQHQYRYLRDVQNAHGTTAALLEGIVMAGVGTAAAVVSGGNVSAGILAGEATGAALGRLTFHDSWDRTNSATYVDPHGGQPVSPGRDFARALGSLSQHIGVHIENHPGFDAFDAISAAGDGIFDLAADPLARTLGVRHAALSEQGLGGVLSRWGGIAIKGEDVAKTAAAYPSVMRAFTDLAGISDPGEIVAKYKKFTPFAEQLAKADTVDKVGQVFVDNADSAQMTSRLLPRTSLAQSTFGDMVEAARQYTGPGSQSVTRFRTFVPASFDETTGKLSRTRLNFGAADSARTIYDMSLWGHNEEFARANASNWINASLPEKTHIFRNVLTENLANRMEATEPGWKATSAGQDALAELGDRIDNMMGGIDGGQVTSWGYDKDGRIISKAMDKGQSVSWPITENQNFYAELPDYKNFDSSLKALQKGSNLYGRADDFLYKNFTQNVFKRWVLASGGFALRVASGELVPQLLGHPVDILQAKVAASMVKHGWEMAPGETDSLMAPIVRFMANGMKLTDENISDLAANFKLNDGHIESEALRSGHEHGIEIAGVENWTRDELYRLNKEVPRLQRVTEETTGFGPDKADHWIPWQADATSVAQSPASRAAAAEYGAAIDEGASEFEASHRASLRAKAVLDAMPADELDQHFRHFSPTVDERVPGVVASGTSVWVPGTSAERAVESTFQTPARQAEGHWEVLQREIPRGESQGRLFGQQGLGERPGAGPHPAREPGSFAAPQTVEGHAFRPGEVTPAGEYTKNVMVPKSEAQGRLFGPQPQGVTGENVSVLPPVAGPQLLEQRDIFEVAPDPHTDWSRVITENVKGKVIGQDGTLHREVLDAIAEGRSPSTDYLKSVEEAQRPARVIGAHEMPAPPRRLSDSIFKKLNTVVNWMSREPIYGRAFLDEMNYFRPLIEDGTFTYDEAIQRANVRATQRMLPHVHNINERTLMSEHTRNFIPFYFAQQQSYARMFRLLAEDPVAFRRTQLLYSKLADFGGVYDDNSGSHQFVIPGLGYLTGGAIKALGMANIPVVNSLPLAFSGNLKSLASLSPFLEGSEVIRPGPLVAMGTRLINNLLPETRALTDPIVGEETAAQPFWEMIVPNTALKNVMKTIVPIDNRTQAKSVLDAIQSLEYQQNVQMTAYTQKHPEPPAGTTEHNQWEDGAPHLVPRPDATPMEVQTFRERVTNHARILTMMKGIIGAFSPVAPSTQIGNYQLKTELYDAIQKDGMSVAIDNFLTAHPDATPYTVFETATGTASPIEATHPAQQWVQGNLGFVTDHRYSAAASYFVPQSDDPFNQSIYNEQMAMGLRHTKAPDQLIEDIHVSEGNRWYFDTYKPAKDAALQAATNPHARTEIEKQFRTTGSPDGTVASLESMKLQNPVWYTNFSSGGRDNQRQLALQQMKTIVADPSAPASPMTVPLKALLKDYDQHSARLLPGRNDDYATAQRNIEKAQWQTHLQQVAQVHPELAMAINNIFRGV